LTDVRLRVPVVGGGCRGRRSVCRAKSCLRSIEGCRGVYTFCANADPVCFQERRMESVRPRPPGPSATGPVPFDLQEPPPSEKTVERPVDCDPRCSELPRRRRQVDRCALRFVAEVIPQPASCRSRALPRRALQKQLKRFRAALGFNRSGLGLHREHLPSRRVVPRRAKRWKRVLKPSSGAYPTSQLAML